MGNIASMLTAIFKAMQTETTSVVQVWMVWMGLIFLASVFFVRRYMAARFVFIAMLATGAAVLYIWSLTKNVHLFGVAHILIWFPLLGYLYGGVLSKNGRQKYQDQRPFFFWVLLLCLTIAISLVFDIRDIFLVMGDKK